MSQLFDSLRRRRKSAPPAMTGARRTAHGDAVLATLGYAPPRRSSRGSPLLVPLAIIASVAVAGYVGWRAYSGSGAVTPATRPPAGTTARGNRPVTPSPASTSPKPAETAPLNPRPTVGTSPATPAASAPATKPPAPTPASPQTRVATATKAPAVDLPTRPATPPPPSAPVTTVERTPRRTTTPAVPVRSSEPPTRKEPPPAAQPATAAPASNAFDLALYYHRAGDFENALVQYRALLQANELNAQAHNNLGLLYQEKNLLDESARELLRAVIIEPGYARGHNNYGVTLLRQGKLDAAASEFRTVLALEPRNVDAMVNLGLVEKSAGQVERAKESLVKALSVAPRHAAAHYNLAVLYEETGELSRAVEHYRAFLDNTGAEYADRAPVVRARLAALVK